MLNTALRTGLDAVLRPIRTFVLVTWPGVIVGMGRRGLRGRMGLRGRIGHGMAYDEKLRMLAIRWVLVGETGQVMVVRLIGWEPRPGLGETRADPPPQEPADQAVAFRSSCDASA